MRNVQFQEKAYQEFIEWSEDDKDIFLKLTALFGILAATHSKDLANPRR